MFDGVTSSTTPPAAPRPQRPCPLDPRAMLPLLRVQGSVATVEGMAVLAAMNAMEAARWTALASPGAGIAAMTVDEGTPVSVAADTLALLAEVCARHTDLTGNSALPLADAVITRHFGADMARVMMQSLRAMPWDLVFAMVSREPAPPPELSPTERRRGCRALADHRLSDPRFDGVADALDAFLAARQSLPPGVEADDALAAVEAALQRAADAGVTQTEMTDALDACSLAGWPHIEIHATST